MIIASVIVSSIIAVLLITLSLSRRNIHTIPEGVVAKLIRRLKPGDVLRCGNKNDDENKKDLVLCTIFLSTTTNDKLLWIANNMNVGKRELIISIIEKSMENLEKDK